MIFEFGNMWDVYEEADVFVITTNSYITQKNKLVMGRGIAREARDRFPGIDKRLAKSIPHMETYGLCADPETGIVGFQVKHHYRNKAKLKLVRYSSALLSGIASEYSSLSIHLNYPGIGNGGLKTKQVLPYIKDLDDNVHIWRFPR